MGGSTISRLIGSSQYCAVTDDALKDEDNAAWVMQLEPAIRQEWIERSYWIRLVDRLAESDLIHHRRGQFRQFQAGWQWLLQTGEVRTDLPHQQVLGAMRDRWFSQGFQLPQYLSILSWDRYLWAISHYHKPDLKLETLNQYETLLQDLGGNFFQVLPFLFPEHWQSARYLGALDQFYNNLRDLQEDARMGVCYLPNCLLQNFGVGREEILHLSAPKNPGYHRMMAFLLDRYLPQLYQKASRLFSATNLHPSWEILRDWSWHRYRRIDRTFRECNFDYNQFPQAYWSRVQQELANEIPTSSATLPWYRVSL
jgi:phytoene synthase